MTRVTVSGGSQVSRGGTLRIQGTYAGQFDPSSGLPPSGTGKDGAILKGDYWDASVAGTITGLSPFEIFAEGDLIYALSNNADSAGEFLGNKGSGGAGTVSSFSAGNLSPLFTTNVDDATTTPSLTFAQVNQNANLVFAGPNALGPAAPTFRSLVAADIPALPYWPLAGSAVLTNDFDITLNSATNTHYFKANDTAIQFRSFVTGFNEYSNIYSGGTNALISRFNSVGPVFNYMNVSDAGVDFVTNALSFTIGGSPGTNGQVLTSNGTNATWATPAVVFSDLIAATGTNTINNLGHAQEWQWNTLGGATGLKLSSTSTAAASDAQALLEVNLSGANATSTQTTYAGRFINSHTGTGSTNVAGYFSASGGTNNYAGIFANGFVGIGISAPTAKLHLKGLGTTTGSLLLLEDSGGTDRLLMADNGSATFYSSYGLAGGKVQSYHFDQVNTTGNPTNGAFMRLSPDVRTSIGTSSEWSNLSLDGFWYHGGAATQKASAIKIEEALSSWVAAYDGISFRTTHSISSGTGTASQLYISPTYNYTGTYAGLVYGLHYNPTLTSMTGVTHYAAAFASGNVVIGASTGNANAILDVQSTTKAFMPPRMTTTQRDAIPSPTAGMVIYNTTTNKLNVYTTAWEAVTSS